MNRKILGWIGGGTALAAVFGAAVWGVYPENQETALQYYQQARVAAGLSDPAPSAQAPFRFAYIGDANGVSDFAPDRVLESCGPDGQVLRLSYGLALANDARRAEIMAAPRVLNDENRYAAYRHEQIHRFLQKRWQADSASLFSSAQENISALQSWLEMQSRALERLLGVNAVFRINPYSVMTAAAARADAVDVCTPAGSVPAPLRIAPAGTIAPAR